MPLVPTGDLVEQARAAGCAVAAFNVITLEHAEGIALGAESAGLPVILQLSENALRFHGFPHALAAASAAVARNSKSDISLHLDHVTDMSLMQMAPELDVSSVMYDGSHFGYAENVRNTREAVEWGRKHGIWIEAELGEVGGKDGAHAPGVRTDPGEALEFVKATGVAALAVAVGSSHAMTSKSAALDHELIRALSSIVPVPLVLHGSSGVPDEELTLAARSGMVKINIGTALNIAYTTATRLFLDGNPSVVDPRKYLTLSRDAIASTVEHSLTTLASGATSISV